MKSLPTVEELNAIQAEWMALDSTGPKSEINRVCKLMERLPRVYVSGHDGVGICMVQGQPMSTNRPFADALAYCKTLGGRTDIAWNGKTGLWYSLPAKQTATQAAA